MSFLDAFDGYDVPYRMTLKHPGTGEPILDKAKQPAYIDLYSPKSLIAEEWKKAQFAEAKREAKKNKKPELSYEEATAKGASYYVAMTAGWYMVNPKTGEGDDEFNADKALETYSDRRAAWIVEQIEAALSDDANFLT